MRNIAVIGATALGVIAVAVALFQDDEPPPGPTPTSAPNTVTAPPTTPTPTPSPITDVPDWGEFRGAPPDLTAPRGGSQEVSGPVEAPELTIRRPDGTVLAKARLDADGEALEARYFDRDGDLTVAIDGTRAGAGSVAAGGARVACASAASANSGFRWTRFPVRWRLGARIPPRVTRSQALAAIRRARGIWNANRSYCRGIRDRSRVRFAFAGKTSRVAGRDGVSVVEFGNVNALGGVCVGTAACTITWIGSGRAIESDTRIHRTRRNGFFTGAPRRRGLDLQSVMVHESGHTLGFGHVSARTVAMFPVIAEGSVRGRRLGRGDALANNRKY